MAYFATGMTIRPLFVWRSCCGCVLPTDIVVFSQSRRTPREMRSLVENNGFCGCGFGPRDGTS
eukprot:3827845-Lingulodinium_polyedra.AAC.1